MKTLLIETGQPPEPICEQFGDYPRMMIDFISPFLPDTEFETCSLIKNERLPRLDHISSIIILGSPHGVYDDIAWINPLMSFIQSAAYRQIPQVGICFGHQIIAKAMGGIVEKAPNGWGIGCHSYDCRLENYWNSAPQKLNLLVSHQDQVIEKPRDSIVLAHSSFTPNAILAYPDYNILTCQAHPEYSLDFIRAIIEYRRGTRFCDELADKAIASLQNEINPDEFAKLMAAHIISGQNFTTEKLQKFA